MMIKAGLLRTLPVDVFSPTGYRDNNCLLTPGLFSNLSRGVIAIERGQPNVQQHYARLKFIRYFYCGPAIVYNPYLIAHQFQQQS